MNPTNPYDTIQQLREQVEYHKAYAEEAMSGFNELMETKKAQAAVIEKLLEAFVHIQEYWNGDANEGAMFDALTHIENVAHESLAIPTDSTQILDEVRKQERERVAQMFEESGIGGDHLAAAIRAME